ncbi:MAG: radical SAM/Cys-rich domain protein [Planctomycetota bacterium]|jgi:radical SAM/Cys-rich protein|nr:MAG: radical SAM/Cys-rich domain protein [Planctomycetota bacterium]
MPVLSLLRQGSPLANAQCQRDVLERDGQAGIPSFQATLAGHGVVSLTSRYLTSLQVNVGKLCNQTCGHCHVDAGPDRRELMTKENFLHCLRLLSESTIQTVDITGGAPEMNPLFEWFVTEVRRLGRHVIDRCNLTILTAPGFTHLPQFLATHQVEVIASLPCYLEANCDAQRGDGVFQKSIEALKLLNGLGYARENSGLKLSLVYNPVGPSLPPNQQQLEQAYRDQLRQRFGIEFNHLYTITNMPISRFLADLLQTGRYAAYMALLVNSFNRDSIENLMCRSTISIDWQGNLYDCDFNQMLDLPLIDKLPRHISSVQITDLENREITVGRHCYGCTAGAGSSCTGSLVRD